MQKAFLSTVTAAAEAEVNQFEEPEPLADAEVDEGGEEEPPTCDEEMNA